MKFTQPALTLPQQLAKLQPRGLQIAATNAQSIMACLEGSPDRLAASVAFFVSNVFTVPAARAKKAGLPQIRKPDLVFHL